MEEWAKLVDKYASELKKYDLVCSFCGQHLDDTNVNGRCEQNTASFMADEIYTEETPQGQDINNGRHFFGKPA
jgi:hypothetical protein